MQENTISSTQDTTEIVTNNSVTELHGLRHDVTWLYCLGTAIPVVQVAMVKQRPHMMATSDFLQASPLILLMGSCQGTSDIMIIWPREAGTPRSHYNSPLFMVVAWIVITHGLPVLGEWTRKFIQKSYFLWAHKTISSISTPQKSLLVNMDHRQPDCSG